ncbi:Acg family FMN-binding oxidoreductase [Nocardia mexicana]|uniref:Nitroreductase family protein n=1 Tax=Nocardia mexicana TaxID=279262 RepID=A0A370HEZ5_9NOCA|nr:NAD(P)H nitroreductase [Nocardia mexicana]RDI55290.1 nitroreductase family protein [Nocardia mexicana]
MNTVPTGNIVEKAVLLAGRAPSLHNSQPWRWVFDGDSLQLFSVRERMLPATDTSGREMIVSCGIALDHLHAALAASGWRTFIRRFPDPNRRDHLATVRFGRASIVTGGDRDRADAIVRRYTDRLPFAAPEGWDEFETVLRTTFDPADAALDVLGDDARPALARASELSAALRRYDSSYHAELQWWTGHVVGSTGVPREALITREEREQVGIGRTMPLGTAAPRRPRPAADRSTILVLSTDGDTSEDWLRCGEVVSRVLLECTLAGYATCPLTHLTEVPRARAVVSQLTGRKMVPQVLIRVGTAPAREEPAPTPRLPLADILRTAGAPS